MRARLPAHALLAVFLATGACQMGAPEYPAWPPPGTPMADNQFQASPGPPSPPPPPASDYASGAAPNAAQLGAPPSRRLVTPGREGSESLTTAAEAPLHEMNLVHEHIPPVLLAALADPYAYPTPLTCDTLAESIERLTVALGPDFDNPPPKRKRTITGSGGLGLQLANGAAGNLLPFHGYIGVLSGSSKHDELILRALDAGAARRAYLKGLGEARDCPAPATPRRLATPATPLYDGPPRPKYPIK
ncbi:MAG: hypothetical protein ACREEB_12695 [Caulobacteraceae bacterium]